MIELSSKVPLVDSHLVLRLDPSLLFPFVEVMLGGKPAGRLVPDRAPTEIEKQLLSLVLTSMTMQLERAWCTVASISLQFAGIEADPQVARLFATSDAVVVARFEVSSGEQ